MKAKKDKLLFVDDESEILKFYESIFKKSESNLKKMAEDLLGETSFNKETNLNDKYEILLAESGEKGIELIEKNNTRDERIKVIFLDMKMPGGIDGGETARRIRAIDPYVEIVIVTAYSDTKLADIVEKVGTPDKLLYLRKPFDVEEIKQLALNLTSKYKNERVKEDFLNNISHELNTPMTAIIGFNDMIIHSAKDNEEIKSFAEIIRESATLMKSLVDDLLITTKLSKNNISINKTNIVLMDFFTKVHQSLLPLFEKTDLELKLNFSDKINSETKYEFDKVHLFQCINNLVMNSLKFTTKGHVELNISFDNKLMIKVVDTGIGIEKDKFEFIFTRFARLEDEYHEKPGLGLGLFITKSLIELHGGEISVESEVDKGSAFTITI